MGLAVATLVTVVFGVLLYVFINNIIPTNTKVIKRKPKIDTVRRKPRYQNIETDMYENRVVHHHHYSGGATIGAVFAAYLSYTTWNSLGWACVHFFCSWFYVVYWAIAHW